MFQRFLDRIEVRFGRYRGIRNLIAIIVATMAVVYAADYVLAPSLGFYLSSYLSFNRTAILNGQVWRLFTFVITPAGGSLVMFVMHLLFLYFTGTLLQNHWGTLKFNIFYFCGMFGSMIAGLITGYATGYYVNLSLMLAVAILYPMMQVNFYGIIPIRMKWLAVIDLALLLPGLISGTWGERAAILVSLLNVVLFFYGHFIHQLKEAKRRYEWKKNWRKGSWH